MGLNKGDVLLGLVVLNVVFWTAAAVTLWA